MTILLPDAEFLLNQITIDTSPVIIIIPGCLFQFSPDIGWNNTRSDDLRMGMLQRRSSRLAMILKNDDQFDPLILPYGQVSSPGRPGAAPPPAYHP